VYFVPINVIICFTRWRSSPSKLVTHIICQQQQVTSLIRHLTEKHCTAKVSKDTGQHTLHSHKAVCECCKDDDISQRTRAKYDPSATQFAQV